MAASSDGQRVPPELFTLTTQLEARGHLLGRDADGAVERKAHATELRLAVHSNLYCATKHATRRLGHLDRVGHNHRVCHFHLAALSLGRRGPSSVFRVGVTGDRAATVDHGN